MSKSHRSELQQVTTTNRKTELCSAHWNLTLPCPCSAIPHERRKETVPGLKGPVGAWMANQQCCISLGTKSCSTDLQHWLIRNFLVLLSLKGFLFQFHLREPFTVQRIGSQQHYKLTATRWTALISEALSRWLRKEQFTFELMIQSFPWDLGCKRNWQKALNIELGLWRGVWHGDRHKSCSIYSYKTAE